MTEQIIRPAAAASGRLTPAAFPFYTTGEDNLRVTSWNTAAGVALAIAGRTINAAGLASPDKWDQTPNTDRTAKTTDIGLSGTTILNLTIFASAGAPQMGQTFVKIDLIRGMGAAAIVLGTILQGYVTATQARGWPGSPIEDAFDGGGFYRTITGTNPGGGNSIVETVPTGARWELLCVTHNAFRPAGINQPLQLRFLSSGGSVIGGVMSQHNFPGGGVTLPSTWSAGYAAPYANIIPPNNAMYSALPTPNQLRAAEQFQVFNDGGGYTFGAPTYQVREWLEP